MFAHFKNTLAPKGLEECLTYNVFKLANDHGRHRMKRVMEDQREYIRELEEQTKRDEIKYWKEKAELGEQV